MYYVDCSVVNFYLHPVHGTVPEASRHHAIRRSLTHLEGRALRMASAVCCFSDAARRELRQEYGLTPERCHVVGAGMNARPFPAYRRRALRRPARVLFVGRDFERKGGPLAVRAVARLDPGAFRLTCVSHADQAVGYGRGQSNVRMLGPMPRQRVMRLMRQADVFIAPSVVEPFGMAVVEAMGHALPVIASRRFAIPEILGPDNPGLLGANSASACAELLTAFATDQELYARVSLGNYLRAQDRFRWRDVAARLVAHAVTVAGRESPT
jgi:glycosyltransferase involved in cell wall biosynthesis